MSKKKSIISYEKLTIDQKKDLLMAFPDGFSGATTKMTNPITGEVMESLLWETDEIIYLVKLPKQNLRPASDDDEEDFEEEEEGFDKFEGDDDDDSSDSDDDDNYDDKAEEEGGEEDEDED